jgi:hypothetical protein
MVEPVSTVAVAVFENNLPATVALSSTVTAVAMMATE